MTPYDWFLINIAAVMIISLVGGFIAGWAGVVMAFINTVVLSLTCWAIYVIAHFVVRYW